MPLLHNLLTILSALASLSTVQARSQDSSMPLSSCLSLHLLRPWRPLDSRILTRYSSHSEFHQLLSRIRGGEVDRDLNLFHPRQQDDDDSGVAVHPDSKAATTAYLCDDSPHQLTCIRGGSMEEGDESNPRQQTEQTEEVVTESSPRPSLAVTTDLLAKARQELAASQARVAALTKEAAAASTEATSAATTTAAAAATALATASKFPRIWTLYLWTLVGTSVVWHLFFYLLSVGYAAGIGLPVMMTALMTQRLTVSAGLTILWSVRLASFLLWREYRAWPAWHARIQLVQRQQRARASHRLVTALSWLTYSVVYLCMSLPVLVGLHPNNQHRHRVFSPAFTTLLQVTGLVLESVADWQKSKAKRARHAHSWCHTGVWKFSTHPNYLGEGLFWWGTVLGGLALPQRTTLWTDWLANVAMLGGLAFITTVLKGAVVTLDAAQREKYANVPAYLDFDSRVGVFGPKQLTRHKAVVKPVATWFKSSRKKARRLLLVRQKDLPELATNMTALPSNETAPEMETNTTVAQTKE